MHRVAAAILLATLVLTGCGGDGDDDAGRADTSDTTDTSDTSDTTEAGTDPAGPDEPAEPAADGECPFVPTAALDEAFGSPFEVIAASDEGCGFQDAAGLTLTLARIDIAIDASTYAEQARASCDEGSIVEVDAGDDAYACIAIGPFAAYYEGDVSISLNTFGADDEQAAIDGLAAVLPSISVP